MTSRSLRFATMGVLSIALALPFCAFAAKEPPQTTFDGLQLQPNTKLGVVYLRPQAEFGGYKRVALLDCAVAFRKDWQRKQNSTNPLAISKDMTIRAALGDVLEVPATCWLGGYELTDKAVKTPRGWPAIIDLDMAHPRPPKRRSKTYSTSAGAMTMR
jgi:hypothetical protein